MKIIKGGKVLTSESLNAEILVEEGTRKVNEINRQNLATNFNNAETSRSANEVVRVNSEASRVTSESGRIAGEVTRVSQEANRQATYTNYNGAVVSTQLIWKSAVATFANIATTYPTPSAGWAVIANDTNIRWRFDGATWINIGTMTTTGLETIVNVGLLDQARAGLIRSQRHSGVVSILPITTGDTTNLNSITIPSQTYSINGYEIAMPQTIVTLPAPDATGTREDLVFFEAYFPTAYTLAGRYRTVAGVNFSQFPEGFRLYGTLMPSTPYAGYAVSQGANSSPQIGAPAGIAVFTQIGETYQPPSTVGDKGIWIAGDGGSTSKTTLGTTDGYSYAIPLFRVKRRNSGGFSVGNFNGGRGYYAIAVPSSGVQGTSYQFTVDAISYNNVAIGDILGFMPNTKNYSVVSKDGSNKVTLLSLSANGPSIFYLQTDRPDSLYANVIDPRDIIDLRHRVQAQFNYDYELRKGFDQFMRGELSPKKMMKTYHGIPKTEVDANTVFYASLDGTTVPEFPLASSAMSLGTGSFRPMPTGSGYKFNGDSATPVAISGLSQDTGSIEVLINVADIKNETASYPLVVGVLESGNTSFMSLMYVKSSNTLYFQESYTDSTLVTAISPAVTGSIISVRASWDASKIYLRVNGQITPIQVTRSASGIRRTPARVSLGLSVSGSDKLKSTISDVSISNIDRGALFPNLPADFISGDAQIMPAFTEQRKLLSQAQMTQTVNGLARIATPSTRGLTPSRTSGLWTSGDTISVTSMAGGLISGVFDADTAIGTIIKDQAIGDTSLTLDIVSGLVVNDTFKVLDRQLGTLGSTTYTVSAITGTVLTITPALTVAVSKYQSLLMETTASSSSPLVSYLSAGVKTTVAGTWTNLATGVATFTLGTNAPLTTGDIQIDYSLIIPSGQPALSVPTTTTLAGEAGFKIPPSLSTLAGNDFTGKISGRTWENPNSAKVLSGIVANNPAPSTFVSEIVTGVYGNISVQDGTCATFSTSVNGQQACILLSFDLIRIVERKLGCKIPAKDTVGKVAWLKAGNLLGLSINTWVNGSSPTGNMSHLKLWNASGNGYAVDIQNTTAISQKCTINASPSDSILFTDYNGFVSVLCCSDPSDGSTPSTINVDYASLDITFSPKVVNSNKLVVGTLGVRDDFAGKVAGNLVACPNTFSTGHNPALLAPSNAGWTEGIQANYNAINVLDNTLMSNTTSVAGEYAQVKISKNLIRIHEDKYGPIPALDKVQWLKDNLASINPSWWGYGSSPVATILTYKGSLGVWSNGSTIWVSIGTNLTGIVSKLTALIASTISDKVDANGFVHFLAYADPSDGVTASTIYTDYCNIELTYKPLSGYDQLVPDNPQRDAGMSQILNVRKETKEVQTLFLNGFDMGLVTYEDYIQAPDPISANTDVTILAEIPEFLVTDLGSAVGMKQGVHHWKNPAYMVGQDNDNLYGEIGFSSVPFAPDNIGVNVGSKINANGMGFNGNYTKQRALQIIPKPSVGIARFLALINGEIKLLVFSAYKADGSLVVAGGAFYAMLINLQGKPLSKEMDGLARTLYDSTQWRTSPLVVQGFMDKATGKLITTGNSI